MAKVGKVWVDDESYIERIKKDPTIKDLADFNKKKPHGVERWCNFDYATKTLTIQLNSGQPVALTFNKNQQEKIGSQALLFEVGYELWEANITDVSRQEVLERCIKKAKKYGLGEPYGNWLKNTRSNLIKTLKKSRVKDLVNAFDLKGHNSDQYHFSIKKPPSQ